MPVPVDVVPLGFWVNVHVPVAGKPVKVTLPVARLQVGCVGVPTEGVVTVPQLTMTLIFRLIKVKDGARGLVTTQIYVPASAVVTLFLINRLRLAAPLLVVRLPSRVHV